jgi:hypothetical protein
VSPELCDAWDLAHRCCGIGPPLNAVIVGPDQTEKAIGLSLLLKRDCHRGTPCGSASSRPCLLRGVADHQVAGAGVAPHVTGLTSNAS